MLSNTILRMKTQALTKALAHACKIGYYLSFCFLLITPSRVLSQIIWQETFATYPNGTQGSAMWTTNHNDCDDAMDNMGNNYWGVFNGEFRVNDIEGFNCMGSGSNFWGDNQSSLTTEVIDISAHACVDLSLDIRSTGGFQCTSPGTPINTTPAVNNGHDQAVIEYRINGGGWTQFATNGYICGNNNLPATVSQTQVSGNTVQIRIRLGNVANSETYYLDDIVVEVNSTTPTLSGIGPFCSSDASTPLSTNQSGITGTWSGTGVIGGNTFNPSTANVGSNTLTFTPNAGQCASSNTMNVTVNAGPDVDDIPNQTACGSYTLPVITGTNLSGSAAYYTATNGGGTQLNPGQNITAATTTVIFIFDTNGGCSDEEQFNVTIIPLPVINDLADQSVCGSYTLPNITGSNLNGNEAYFTQSGRLGTQYNPGQVITNTTTLYIHGGTGGCSDEEEVLITITPAPDVNDIPNATACGSYVLPAITGTNLTGNEAYFTQTNGGGTQYNPGQTISSNTVLFIYDGTGSCDDEETFSITINSSPTVDDIPNQTACGSYTLPNITGTNLTGNEAYYTLSGGNGTQYNPGQSINTNLTLFIYDGTSGCDDEESFSISITAPPAVDDLANQNVCGSYTLPAITGTNLTGNEAYYTNSGGAGTQFNAGQTITNSITLFIYDGSGSCSDEEAVTITITSPPDINDITSPTTCGSYTLPNITGTNLTGNEAYYTLSGGGGTQYNPGETITSNITLFIYGGSGSCSDEEQFTINFIPPPTVNDRPNQTACGSYTLPNITGTNLTGNQAYYTGPNGTGTEYNSGDQITNSISLFIYDGVAPCDDQQQFTITINPAPNINDIPTQNVCGNYTLPNITGTNLTGNEAYYTGPSGSGTRLDPGDEITNSITLFIYGGSGSCSDEELFSVNVTPRPEIDPITNPTVCGSYTLPAITGNNLTGGQAYYTNSGGLGTSYNPGDVINTTTTLFMYDGAPGCNDQEQIIITVNPPIDIDDLADQNACNTYTLPNITGTNLTGNEAYFTQSGGQGTQFNPGDNISTTTLLFIYGGSPGCEDEEQVNITITPAPDVDDLADQTACTSFTLPNITGTNLTGNEAYFTQSGGQGTQFNPGENITATTALFIYDGTSGCEDEEQVTITITPAPDVDDLVDPTSCANYTLPPITGTNLSGNEAYYSQSGGLGTQLNPGESISVTTTLFIYDESGACNDEEEFTVAIAGQPALDPINNVSICGSFTLPAISGSSLSGNEAYFTGASGTGTRFVAGDVITNSTTLFAFDGAAGCEDETSFAITITSGPDITPLDEQSACSAFTLPVINGTNLTGNEAYFTGSGGTGTRFSPGDVISDSQTLFIYDGATGCEDEEAFSLTIIPEPQIDDIPNQEVCESFMLPTITGVNLSGNEGYFDGANGTGNTFQAGDIIDTDQVLFIWDNSSGCNSQQVFEIIVNPAPEVVLVPTPVSCAGGNDGGLATSIISGVSPFTYDWNFDQFDGQDTLSDITAGIYSLRLTDGNNCTTTSNMEILEPSPITLTCQENTPVSSVGGNDGVASISLSGGSPPYALNWDNAGTSGNETIDLEGDLQLSDLTAGNYSVVVLDVNNCEASCNFTITDPACSLTISTTATDATCHNSDDGSITVTINNGQAPFSFSWNDPVLNGIQNPTDLAPGDYMLSVNDANGCEVIASTTVDAPTELSLSGLSVTPVSASGQSDGGVSVNYQGGTPPYQLSWEGAIFGTLSAATSGVFDLNVFPEGDYTLRISDGNGCQAAIDFTIPGVNCALSLGIQGQDLNCFEDRSGRIQLTITGGISPLNIDWNIDTLDGIRNPQDLAAGDYEVIVTDANGCSATESISLQEPSPLLLTCTAANEASAPGASDGTINIEVSGGEPNYTVDWSNGIISGSENLFIPGNIEVDNLSAGDYEVFLFDDNGCMTTCGVEVTELCPTTESTFAPTLCAGESIVVNGNTYDSDTPSGQEILLNANSLGCDSIVNIDLQFLPEATNNIIQELCQGEILIIGNTEFTVDNPTGTAIIPNASPDGCDSIINVSLTFIEAAVFSLEGNGTTCPGTPVSLTFRASNFSGPVDIIISDSNGELTPVPNLTDGSTFEVSPTANTSYRIMDTNANGDTCPPVLEGEVTIEVTDLLIDLTASDYNGFQLSCNQAMDGSVEVSIEGGTGPFTYAWSNGATTSSLINLSEGPYELTVTDAIGCQSTSEILLSAPAAMDATVNVIPPGCNGNGGVIRIEGISGGTAPFSLSLNGATPQSINGLPFDLASLESGNYDLQLLDANGCTFETSLEVPNEESLLLDLGGDITIRLGDNAKISAISNFTIDKFIWEPNDSIVDLGNNEFLVSPMHTTIYTFTAIDAAGCAVSDQITVLVDRNVDLFRPTVFSPNNDGVNDVFQVFAGPSVTRINSFLLFDRWGNTLYEGRDSAPNDPSLGWDGTYRGQAMNAGVYVYYLEVTFVDGRTEVFKGDVALLR